jgi:hypothetical protein
MRNLRITTAPTATAATTAARTRVRFPSLASLSDELLALLITEATEAAESHIGRPLARATYTELLPGTGTEILRLGRAPLESITSITIDGELLDAAGYDRIDDLQPNVRRKVDLSTGGHRAWDLGRRGVGYVHGQQVAGLEELLNTEAVYVAGYWLPTMASTPPAGVHLLPGSLEGAVQRMIHDKRQAESVPVGVSSIKKGDRTRTYLQGFGEVAPAVMEILERERAVYS